MPEAGRCPKCGATLLAEIDTVFCPACAMRAAFEAEGHDPERVVTDAPISVQPGEPEIAAGAATRAPKIRRFGDYELLEEIARGGMGVVYRARQVSLNRIVAVKTILAGQLASAADVERFRAEAQAAASLQHPNIVAIHEVGLHDGQQYFSMDYIKGRNLAEVVREGPLPARQAARYLKTIAEAIHFAHQRGILHRDLKPSNVLLDLFDQPRVTDFGLAKQMKSDSGLTRSGQVLGSPNFMPPEQAASKHGQVGPHSDVYSLGAILYYLLTGRPPFAAETLADTLQQVCQREPAPLRLWNPSVPRDVETICLKCLEKEPRRRYATAHELAEELARFLRDEPIQARPVGALEKTWRWCRRNPVVSSLSAGIVLLVLAVAIGSPIAAYRINRERQQAQAQAMKSAQVATFLKEMLQGVGPGVALGRDTTLLREILDKTVERVGKDLRGQPEVEAELRSTIGEVYRALGQYDEAEAMHREALALRSRLWGKEHRDVATSLNQLGLVLQYRGKSSEAETLFRDALAMRRKLLGNEDPDVATSLTDLGLLLYWKGKRSESEAAGREALALKRKLFGDLHLEVARSLACLVPAVSDDGKTAEAEAMQHEALAIQRKLLGNEHPSVAYSLYNLSHALARQHKLAEAETTRIEALAIWKKVLGTNHPNVPDTLSLLAQLQVEAGKRAEAEATLREALAIQNKLVSERPQNVELRSFLAQLKGSLAALLMNTERRAEAIQLQHEAVELERKLLAEAPRDVSRRRSSAQLKVSLADLLMKTGRRDEAAQLQQEAVEIAEQLIVDFPDDVELRRAAGRAHEVLGDYFSSLNRTQEAEEAFRRCLAIRERLAADLPESPVDSSNLAWSYYNLGVLLEATGRSEEGAEDFRQSLGIMGKLVVQYPESLRYQQQLGWMLATCPAVQFRDPRRAIALAAQRLQRDPKSGEDLSLLGIAQYRAGDPGSAIESFHKAMELLEGGAPEQWLFLAMALVQKGDRQQAQQWYDKAVSRIRTNHLSNEEMARFSAEAEKVLGKPGAKPPATDPPSK